MYNNILDLKRNFVYKICIINYNKNIQKFIFKLNKNVNFTFLLFNFDDKILFINLLSKYLHN